MDAEDTDRNLQWELGNALAVVEQLIDDLPEDRREQCLTAARRAVPPSSMSSRPTFRGR